MLMNSILDSGTLKRMLKPMTSIDSPATSPEMSRRRYNYYKANADANQHIHQHAMHQQQHFVNNNFMRPHGNTSRFSNSRSAHEIGRGCPQQQRGLYLELDRERGCMEGSPPSDNVLFDNQCYATTPSSSNGNSDQDQSYGQRTVRHSHHHSVRTYDLDANLDIS